MGRRPALEASRVPGKRGAMSRWSVQGHGSCVILTGRLPHCPPSARSLLLPKFHPVWLLSAPLPCPVEAGLPVSCLGSTQDGFRLCVEHSGLMMIPMRVAFGVQSPAHSPSRMHSVARPPRESAECHPSSALLCLLVGVSRVCLKHLL